MSGTCHAAEGLCLEELGLDPVSSEVQTALSYLEAEGLVVRRGSSVFLAEKPARSKRSTGFIDDYAKSGRKPLIRSLELDIIPRAKVPEAFSEHLEAIESDLFIRHHNVQIVDATPHAICTSFIPYEFFGCIYPNLENSEQDLFSLMRECGYAPDRKREALRFDFPTQPERDLLEIGHLNRVMIVRLDCVVWSGDRIVELCELVDRADLYEFVYEVPVS